jgi:release factor glutamine methyltransferase
VLTRLGFATAALDAKLLTGHELGLDSLALSLREDDPVADQAAEHVAQLIQRRMGGESVGRIIGEREFYGLAFGLNSATLEPRPETELLVDLAIKRLPQGGRLLDLGTGTGCVPVSVLVNRPDAIAVATDLAAEALDMGRRNAGRHGVEERLGFLQGDWFAPLRLLPLDGEGWEGEREATMLALSTPHPTPPRKGERVRSGMFDLIVSNPPYIASSVIETLSPEVKDFDPLLALDGGPDGLAPYRVIAAEAGAFLKPGGQVMVEIGFDQGEAVATLFRQSGFQDIAVHKDLAGLDRVVVAHHMGKRTAQPQR